MVEITYIYTHTHAHTHAHVRDRVTVGLEPIPDVTRRVQEDRKRRGAKGDGNKHVTICANGGFDGFF